MNINNIYPRINRNLKKKNNIRKTFLLISLISLIICIIVNISVGGYLWFLYVLGGLIILFLVINKPLIENSLPRKFTILIFVICGYLYLIDLINKTHWSFFVISIILFSMLIIQASIFFSFYGKQKKEVTPIFLTSTFSLILIFLGLVGIIKITWPIIVLGSLAFLLFIVFFTIIRKNIVKELKKYFSIK